LTVQNITRPLKIKGIFCANDWPFYPIHCEFLDARAWRVDPVDVGRSVVTTLQSCYARVLAAAGIEYYHSGSAVSPSPQRLAQHQLA
jgi:hypothetical protein